MPTATTDAGADLKDELASKRAAKKRTPAKKPAAKKAAKKPAAKKATTRPKKYADPIPLDDQIFRPDRLDIDIESVDWDLWSRIGDNLLAMATGHQWWIGDWFHLGEQKWGHKAYGYFNVDNYDETTISQYVRVAEAFPPAKRRADELSWTHHKSAAGIPEEKVRYEALQWAIDNGADGRPVSDADFRAYVRTLKADDLADAAPTPTERKVDHTWRVSYRLNAAEETIGDKIHAEVVEYTKARADHYGVELLGFEPAKS